MHPILFDTGQITLYSYGTMVALGFLIATYLVIRELRKNPVIEPNQAVDLVLVILIFGIIGARLLHVFLNMGIYFKQPMQILFLNRGGLAFHGGIVFAVLASLFYLTKKHIPIRKTGDLIVPYVALGHAIGRIGCFLNGCCFGHSAHPTQLYSAAGLFIIFLILKRMYRKKHFDGQIFFSYLIIYPAFRFFIDFLRADLEPVWIGLTISQFLSLSIFAIAIIILSLNRSLKR